MSRSVIYTNNGTSQNVSDGGAISLGNIIRRYGCNCQLLNNAINLDGTGYYDISGTVTLVPSAAGTVTVTGYQDGNIIPGVVSSGTVAAEDTTITLPIVGMIRNVCCQTVSNLTFVLSGGEAEITNVSMKVTKT